VDKRQAAGGACCAVILAGGRNTRMQGQNKAFLTVDGRTILDRLIDTLKMIFSEILLVARQAELYPDLPVRVVEDIYKARSSLTGIHAGLKYARADYAFVVPCDAPFLKPDLIRLLVAEIAPTVDAVVPFINGYYEPLCAIYSKRCVNAIEDQLNRNNFKITHFFDSIHLKKIPEETIKPIDPQMHSFLNINTPEAYKSLQDLFKKRH